MGQDSASKLKKFASFTIALSLIASTVLLAGMSARMSQAQEGPSIALDQPYYVPGETAEVTIEVPELAGSGETSIIVFITSEGDPEGMSLEVFEGEDDDGVFVGSFYFQEFAEGPSDPPTLNVEVGDDGIDVINAAYQVTEGHFIDTSADFLYPIAFFDSIRYQSDDQAVLEFPNPPLHLLSGEIADELPVLVTSDTDTDGIIVILQETGSDTNVFLSDPIEFTTTGSSDEDGSLLLVSDGDELHTSFELSEGDFYSSLSHYGSEPTLNLDSDSYDVGDTATVEVIDLFANDPGVLDSVSVSVGSDCDESGIDFEIDEVAIDSGSFSGTFDFTDSGSSEGTTLEVCSEGDEIQANYESELVGGFAFDTATISEEEEASEIAITDATHAYWGVGVGLSGTTTGFGGGWSIEIDWGDGETTVIPVSSTDWSIDAEDGHEYDADHVGETFDVVATLEVSDFDGGLVTVAVSEPFSIEVLKRPTNIDPYFENEDINPASVDFRSALELKRFTVGGTLTDAISGEQLVGRDISYIGSSAPLSHSVTQGVKFTHASAGGIEVVDCNNSPSQCSQDVPSAFGSDPYSGSNMVVHLKPGGKIILPPNTLDVQIYLQDMGVGTFVWRVIEGNGATQQNTAAAAGAGALVIPILGIASGSSASGASIVPNGLVQLEILSVDPDGAGAGGSDPDATVGIAGLVTHDFTANQQYALSFETETAGIKTSPYEVNPGAFFSTGTAAAVSVAGAPDLDRTIQMVFDGTSDPLYESTTGTVGFIDILPDSSGISGAIAKGGAATTILDDAGNDIVQYSCAVGNDVDGDMVCDSWEGAGLGAGESGIINVGGSSYILCGSGAPEECDGIDDGLINSNDIYVEVDAQSGYMFTDSVFTSIKNVFSQAPVGSNGKLFKLHLVKDESTIDAVLYPTKIWKDTSSSWLNGLQTHRLDDGDGIVGNTAYRKLTISGLDVFTTGAIPSPGHKVNLVVKIVFTADPGVLSNLRVGTVTGKGTSVSSETFAFGTVTPTTGTTRNIPITITYQTSGATDSSALGDLGDIPISFNVAAAAATTAKIAATSNLSIGSGSQIIVSNDDFDGIKRAYFGTPSERNTALGSFGQERANLVAKAQVYHYGLIVRSSGNTKIVCGNSGHSELGGNDFLVALGARDTSATNTTPVNCFTGPFGSDNEQIGTFLHEMGHNFNWKHGGGDDDNCKPNYPSLMSYSRQIPITGFGTWKATFSREALATLDERSLVNGGVGISEVAGIVLSAAEWVVNTALDIVFGRGGTPIVYSADNIADTSPVISLNGISPADETLRGFDINYLSGVPGCNTANNKQLVGFDDWANIDLNFKDGKPIDGLVYPIGGQNSENNDKITKAMIKAGNKGDFSGLLDPINKVYLNDFDGISLHKKKSTIPLKVSYLDSSNNPITTAKLYVKIVKINNGVPEDAITESTNSLAGDSGVQMRVSGGQYIYNLATANLQAPATYGVEIWRDSIGTGTKLDNDSDGYAGFFSLKS